MLSDSNSKKIDFGEAKVKRLGKNFQVFIESGDLNSLQKIIDIIHKYGISSQEDHDDDLTKEEEAILEMY